MNFKKKTDDKKKEKQRYSTPYLEKRPAAISLNTKSSLFYRNDQFSRKVRKRSLNKPVVTIDILRHNAKSVVNAYREDLNS